MQTFKLKIGYYTSVVNLTSTLLFAFCFFGLFAINPIFEWTSIQDYVAYCKANNQLLKHIAQTAMVILSVSLLVMIAVLDDFADSDKKLFSKLSLVFVTISTTLLSMGYFIQITTVRWNFENTEISGLEHFIQFYPNSAILAVIMLGYTLFLGLSCISILPFFEKTRKDKLLRLGFLINGISCLLGLIGFVFQIAVLTLLATNIGNGIGLIILGIGGIRYFKNI